MPSYFQSISGKLFTQDKIDILAVYGPGYINGSSVSTKSIASVTDLRDHFEKENDGSPPDNIL